jgi:hypothetical protein
MLFKKIEKDERTTFIENQSYKYGCSIFNFGLLIDIMYRAIRFNETSWDLYGLIFLSGFVMTVYQYKQKIFTKKWINNFLYLILFSAVIGIVIAFIFTKLKVFSK